MESDSYQAGYITGRCISKVLKCVGVVKVVRASFRCVATIAKAHKIDSSDATAVAKNLFECLPFID